jgi:hypothetical protein
MTPCSDVVGYQHFRETCCLEDHDLNFHHHENLRVLNIGNMLNYTKSPEKNVSLIATETTEAASNFKSLSLCRRDNVCAINCIGK